MSIEAISAVAAGAAAPATLAPAGALATLTPGRIAESGVAGASMPGASTPGASAATGVTPQFAVGESARSDASVFDVIVDGIAQVNRDMHATQQAVQEMALGKSDNLHQVMMSLEQTRLSFELLLQVRNRVLEAYQEMMRMQV